MSRLTRQQPEPVETLQQLLVVEDEAKLAANLKRGLEEAGYGVVVATDAQAARRALGEGKFDLMTLDLRLPGEDGLEFLHALRAAGSALPVLVLTARGSTEERVSGLDGGADDYLIKPFAFSELLARVRALLRRPVSATRTLIEVGELRLDSARRQAWRQRRELNLSPKELMLLEYLMRRAGVAVSRDTLGEALWGTAYKPLSNLIEVFINRVRQKIDQVGQPSMIVTVRGRGYLLRVEVPEPLRGGGLLV